MAGEVIVARERNADFVNIKTGRLRRAGRNMLGLENE